MNNNNDNNSIVPVLSNGFCLDTDEPILKHNDNRYVFSPIKFHDVMEMYEKQMSVFWDVKVINMSNDYNTFKLLPAYKQHFIVTTVAFFAASDGIVNENIIINLLKFIQHPEFRAFYLLQAVVEMIHSRAYALTLEEYVPDAEKRNELILSIHNHPTIKKKAEFALKYMMSTNSFAEIIVAFACVEGISFSGSFCAIYWFKHMGIALNGLIQSNEYIARDEGIHYSFAVMLYNNYIKNKLTSERITEIVSEAVEIECEYIKSALPERMEGMNADLMSTYIKFIADKSLLDLKCPKLYNAENPFSWMESISVETKSNFFEKRVSDYNNANSLDISKFSTEEVDF